MASTSWTRSRGRPFSHVFPYLLFALGVTFSSSAQEVAVPPPALLYNDDSSVDTNPIQDVILRELERQLSEEMIDHVVLTGSSSVGGVSADTILLSEFGIAEDRIYLSLVIQDAQTGGTVGGAAGWSALDIGLFNQVARLYREISPLLLLPGYTGSREERVPDPPTSEAPRLVGGLRFVSSQDGVVVRRPDGQLLGVTEDGELVAEHLVIGASDRLPLVLERPGFYSRSLTVEIDPQDRVHPIELPDLDRATRVATYLGWTPQQVLGLALGGRYYLQPDQSFFQLELLYHLQKDFQGAATGGTSHFDTRLAGGRYFLFDYSFWFRVSLEGAFGVIYTTFPGREVEAYVDPYVVPIALSLEANGRHVAVFARFETRFALSGGRAFFPRGIVEIPGQELPIFATLGVLSKW